MLASTKHVFAGDGSVRRNGEAAFLQGIEPWDMRSSGIAAEKACASLVSDAIERGVRLGRIPFRCNDELSMLCNLGLVRGGMLTNAAALMFCRSVAPLVVCRAYDSSRCDVLTEGLDCYGPLDAAFRAAFAFLERHVRSAFSSQNRAARHARASLSAAFEGCLSNALVHRDYRLFSPVRVTVCPGIVEVRSPGAIPAGVFFSHVVEAARKARLDARRPPVVVPSVRNALLVQALYRFGAIDAQGTGIARIVFSCSACGLTAAWANRGGCALVVISDCAQ